jgi:hypothetical protein
LLQEVLADLRWAEVEYHRGALDAFLGRSLAIVNRVVYTAEGNLKDLRQKAAREAGVPPERVAVFHVPIAD